jgi:hypothetical protein
MQQLKSSRGAGCPSILAPAHESAIGSPPAFSRATLTPEPPLGQRFTRWFPYLFDWIHKPADGDWATESRYPLSPAQLWGLHQSPDTLGGVRFDKQTSYFVVDLDTPLTYQPEAIERALEPLMGGAELVRVQSSHSGGLHLYGTLPQPVSTWDLACALRRCLEEAGIEVEGGQCEIFPNTKAYSATGTTRYAAHRLPLQPHSGSYLLSRAGEPISDRVNDLLNAFDRCAAEIDWPALQAQLLIPAKRSARPSGSAEAWRADLESVIAQGWTGPGQTNEILGKLAQYGRVFLGLAGEALHQYIQETAKALTGFQQWCREAPRRFAQHCKGWVASAMKRYRPYRSEGSPKAPRENQNEARAKDARDRIAAAVAALEASGEVPQTIGALASSLSAAARCGQDTLYKNKELWHPEHRLAAAKVHNRPEGKGYSPPEPAEPAEPAEVQNPETIENRGHYAPCPMKRYAGESLPKNEVLSSPLSPAALQAVGNPRTEGADRTQIHRLRNRFACAQIFGKPAHAAQVRREVQALGYDADIVLAERWDGRLSRCHDSSVTSCDLLNPTQHQTPHSTGGTQCQTPK